MANHKEFKERMQKSLDHLASEFATVRAGRANAGVLDHIQVEYYGSPTPIQQVASISSPDPRSLVIQPWDSSILKGIEKAIQASDLGINPQNDGSMLRLSFPPLTEERRKELAKDISKKGEAAKVALRNIRRDANDKCKELKKAGSMTEDEQKASEKSIQDLTDKYIKEVDAVTSKKEKEIMQI